MKLAYDKTRCRGEGCTIRDTCLRHTCDPPEDGRAAAGPHAESRLMTRQTHPCTLRPIAGNFVHADNSCCAMRRAAKLLALAGKNSRARPRLAEMVIRSARGMICIAVLLSGKNQTEATP